jgi:hypothetical protein
MSNLLEVEYEKIFSPKTMAGLKGKSGESLRAMLGNKTLAQTMIRSKALLDQIIEFFKTGIPPVSKAETLEIYTFMEAADESKRNKGQRVFLEEVFKKASL